MILHSAWTEPTETVRRIDALDGDAAVALDLACKEAVAHIRARDAQAALAVLDEAQVFAARLGGAS